MSRVSEEQQQKLLQDLIDLIKAGISVTDADITDRWARQLGKIDLQRFLGSDISLSNPVLQSIVQGGEVRDPRYVDVTNLGLLVNGDFEDGLRGWRTSGTVTIISDANSGVKAIEMSPGSYIEQDLLFPVNGGSNFELSFAAKGNGQIINMTLYTIETTPAVLSRSLTNNYVSYYTTGAEAPASYVLVRAIRLTANAGNAVNIQVDTVRLHGIENRMDLIDNVSREVGKTTIKNAISIENLSSPNSGFESGDLRGWVDRLGTANVGSGGYTGNLQANVFGNAGNIGLVQIHSPPLRFDDLLVYSAMVKKSLLFTSYVRVYYTDGTSEVVSHLHGGTSWEIFNILTSLVSGAGKYIIATEFYHPSPATSFGLDDFKIFSIPMYNQLINLNVSLSTRASEATLQTRATELTLNEVAYGIYRDIFTDTTTPLAGGATFTGNSHDAYNKCVACATATSDQNGTLYIDQSDNPNFPANQVYSESVALVGGTPVSLISTLRLEYWRVRYVNGGVAQGQFWLASTGQNWR